MLFGLQNDPQIYKLILNQYNEINPTTKVNLSITREIEIENS